ncbi:MAG: hypothetical protein IKC32_01200, partial [Clostridia bacterium]|nr:hypothetical protein [Clostridia bacterium]
GVALGGDGAKYAAPVVVSVPFAADWAIIRSGEVYKSGSNKTAVQGTSSSALVVDPFFDVLPEGKDEYNVVFYNDYVGYGRSGQSGEIDGVPTTQKGSSANRVGGKVLIDLNGYTFTNAAVYQHYFVGYAANYRVHFRNGNVVQNATLNLVAATSPGYAGFIILENCNVDTVKGTIFDQRGGMVIYKDSTVKTESAMSNVKAIGEYKTGVTVINCVIDGGEGTLLNLSQTNATNDAGGKSRNGSSGFFVRYEDSVIRTESTLGTFETYANKDFNADEYKANIHDFFVDIKNCDIETYSTLISQTTALLPAEGDNILDIDFQLNVSGSTIQAFGLLSTGGNNDHALVDFDANINVEDAGLKLIRFEDNGHKALGGLVITQKALDINVNLAEGVKLDGFRAGRPASGYFGATVNLPEGANVVYSSLLGEGYNCFISSGTTETYSYKLGEQEPVEFLWNVPAEGTDEVDVNRVVDLYEKEGFYHYTWAPYAGEKLFTTEFHNDYTLGAKANLTVFENFTFNLYIPASEYKAFSSLSILDNKGVAAEIVDTVEIDGVSYYKYSVAGLTPDMAEVTALSVSYEITAAYGETISGGKDVCVLDYLESYTSMEEGDEQDLVKAIAQYVYYAYVLAGRDTTNVAPLVSGWGFAVPDRSTAKWDALAGVEVAVNYGNGLAWAFKAAAGTELAVTYYANGEAVDETIVVAENGYAYLPVLNCDYNQDVVVTIGENSASFNLVGYIYELVDLLNGAPMHGDTNIEMANAIYHFAREAAEYKLVLYPPVVEETPAEPAE